MKQLDRNPFRELILTALVLAIMQALLVKVFSAPAPTTRSLAFQYVQEELPYIATFTYRKSGMPTNWVVLTNVARTNLSVYMTTNGTYYGTIVPIDAGIQLYTVTAVDTNGIESSFSNVLLDFTPRAGTNLKDMGTNQPVAP